ncbi:creatininase family protein [Humitalea sp. 24SJ18S-53]|uniref:creatininase family protein n=1 Tax=Humitalea sp. 24SJ18S-53 TaxID=3422307 RepID=UPI003D67173E
MPAKDSVWMHELSWDKVEAHLRHDDVALVPIGATEQHGLHAPMMLDTGWAIVVAEEAARLAGCLVTPPLHFGWSSGHMAFPGCIGLRAETLTAVAMDIANSLLQHGFRRIVFVNGNRIANLPPLEIAAVKLRVETGAAVAVADCGLIAREEVAALCDGAPGAIGHVGETETSMILAYWPELTDLSRAQGRFEAARTPAETGKLRRGHGNIDPRMDGDSVFFTQTPEEFRARTEARFGVDGDESLATAEKGRKMVGVIAGRLAEFVGELREVEVEVRKPGVFA